MENVESNDLPKLDKLGYKKNEKNNNNVQSFYPQSDILLYEKRLNSLVLRSISIEYLSDWRLQVANWMTFEKSWLLKFEFVFSS